jgi:beta-glucosidase
MPSPLGLAATWNPTIARMDGLLVANEAKAKANDAIYAPTIGIMRTPLGGRTFEAFGEDPFLSAQTAVPWIGGVQSQGVMADAAIFAANDQEGADPTGLLGYPGLPLGVGLLGSRMLSNSVVDDRTLHEIYLPAFEAAVKQAHVATVMCSYNMVNGVNACENKALLQDILRATESPAAGS